MSSQNSVSEAIFAVERLSFAYPGGVELLKDVNFALYSGEQVGLYGPNGSGKTSFFRIITGLLHPNAGNILFHGVPITDEKGFQTLRRQVGFVLQHAEDQLFCPTVLEDVAFGSLNLGLTPEMARERAQQTLESLGLFGFEEKLTHRLSGGEKKLVSIATVLSMHPEALLLDEPTNDLDPKARLRIIEVLQAMPSARVIVSHDWEFLSATSSSFISLVDGSLRHTAPSKLSR